MPLTNEQAFKFGFLRKCAEDGLTIQETKQRVKDAIQTVKEATEKKAFIGQTASALGSLLSAAGVLGIAAPVAVGGLGGYGLAKATSGEGSAVAEAKNDEIIGEYRRLAEEARRRARLKALQNATGQRVIALTPGET